MPPSTKALALTLALAWHGLCTGAVAQPVEDHRFCDEKAANVVLFLDVTTPYDEADRSTLVSGIERIFDGLGDGDRISIRTIEEAFSNSHRLLDMCVPYCPQNGFLRDLFSSCTMGVVINEKKRLRAAIKATLHDRLADAEELPTSEIIRTIASAAKEEYRPNRTNRFYIFSDMIENSAYLSGRTFLSTDIEELMTTLRADKLIPHLSNAGISVFGFGRTGVAERTALSQQMFKRLTVFWSTYFEAAGASLSVEQHLSGAN